MNIPFFFSIGLLIVGCLGSKEIRGALPPSRLESVLTYCKCVASDGCGVFFLLVVLVVECVFLCRLRIWPFWVSSDSGKCLLTFLRLSMAMRGRCRYLLLLGFPTKETWLKAIYNDTLLSWPLINVKDFNKHFSDSEESQKGHMRNLHKNTRSASRTTKKKKTPYPADATRLHYAKTDFSLYGGSAAQISKPPKHPTISKPIEKKNGLFIQVYNPTETLYTDQTGKFPVCSSSGQQNQVVSHHV